MTNDKPREFWIHKSQIYANPNPASDDAVVISFKPYPAFEYSWEHVISYDAYQAAVERAEKAEAAFVKMVYDTSCEEPLKDEITKLQERVKELERELGPTPTGKQKRWQLWHQNWCEENKRLRAAQALLKECETLISMYINQLNSQFAENLFAKLRAAIGGEK